MHFQPHHIGDNPNIWQHTPQQYKWWGGARVIAGKLATKITASTNKGKTFRQSALDILGTWLRKGKGLHPHITMEPNQLPDFLILNK